MRAEDMRAAEEVLNAGVKLISTVHGGDMEDLQTRPYLRELVEKGIFERYVFLSRRRGTGTVEEIRNSSKELLWKEDGA